MGKKKSTTPPEETLLLPTPPSSLPIVDTHTHIASTFEFYRARYKEGAHTDVRGFIKAMYAGRRVEAVVDVWCEAPVRGLWREFADAALQGGEGWGGMEYWFVLGVHPHDAKSYTDEVEKDILEAMAHPRCVGWGEMGLDYHYDNSPREVQQAVFARQLRHAVRLGKPLTIHTREADEDTERILKGEVPREHKIHIHCFTDSPSFAQRLLDHFPNLYIGITGVITYATNTDTSTVIRNMVAPPPPQSTSTSPESVPTQSVPPESEPTKSTPACPPTPPPTPSTPTGLRILLETDAPFMVPANLYDDLPTAAVRGKKLPLCHSAMVPWTAKFVAEVANAAAARGGGGGKGAEGEGQAVTDGATDSAKLDLWDADIVMRVARENARKVYGV